MTEAAAKLVVRFRFAIVAFWCIAAVVVIVAPPSGAPPRELSGLVPDDAPSIATRLRSASLFAAPMLTETLVVQRAPEGLGQATQQRVVDRVGLVAATIVQEQRDEPLEALSGHTLEGFPELGLAVPLVNNLAVLPGASEHGTTAVTYLFFPPQYSVLTRTRVAHTFANRLIAAPDDALVGVTGATPARAEQGRLIKDALPLIDIATILVVLLVVGVHFRAIVAPLVVLSTVGITIIVARAVVTTASGVVGIPVPGELEPLIIVLVLGVVADYAIFFLSSMRAALRAGLATHDATRRATAHTLPLVLAAVLVVAAGTASVSVARLGFFRALGPSLAVAVLTAGLVSATLVPALMAILGRSLYWPASKGHRPARARRIVSFGTAAAANRSRVRAAVAAVVVLAFAGLALNVPLGFGLIHALPASSEVAKAARAVEIGIAPGAVAPTVILLERPGIGAQRVELSTLERGIEQLPDVAGVIGPREQPGTRALGAVISEKEDAARLLVILRPDPLSTDGIAALHRIKGAVSALVAGSGLGAVKVSYGGDTALADETVSAVEEDLLRVAAAALAVNFLLILLFLRSIVAAAYLLAASSIALAAAIGILRLLFVDVLGHPDITYYVPFAAAVLLLSLGSDYTIFVAGRVWQHAAARPISEAVDPAVAETAGPVTAAGVALALSFALLALVPTVTFRELAFVLAAGVLLDAFVIRTILVPVMIHLVGETNRWPRRAVAPPLAEPGA